MKFTFLNADNIEKVLDWKPENFSQHIAEMPLGDELAKADELDLCSPTISIIKEKKHEILWGSIISDDNEEGFSFVVGYEHEGKHDDNDEVPLEEFLNIAEDFIAGRDIFPKFYNERNYPELSKKPRGFFTKLFGL